jgi:zinc protease
MVNSTILRKDLDTEMTVVRNEMESGENSPDRILMQRLMALMYDWHNYGHDTIGARADVENVDIPRLQAFYRQYYQPDNATLIVSGKFEPARVLRWVGDAFGKIRKPTRKLPVQYTLDPAQDGERSVTLRRSGGTPQIFAAYHVPPAAHPDYPAIEVLDLVMGDTPSGRLHKRLTEKQLAASTFGFAQALAEPGFTLFGAQLAPGQAVEPAREALLATVESTASEPITDEEFKRAQGKWLKAWEQAFTNPETVGVSLSESVAQGDWRLFFLLRDRVRDLKLADVQRVADQRFIASNRTLGIYLPTDKPQRPPAPAKVDVVAELKGFKPQQAQATAEAFDSSPANIDQRTQRFQVGGVKAALLPKASRGGTVHATLTLHFGTEKSLAGLNDVPDVTAALLDKGTKTLTRQQVQDRLDELKTEMGVASGPGRVSVSLLSRRETLPQEIALVADLLRNASLPADALDELKRQTLAAIEQQRKEPESVVDNALGRIGNPYPRGDVRYVRSFDEMVQDVNGLTLAQLQAFHQRFYSAAHAEFGAAGDMDVPAVKAALQAAFGNWQNSEPYARVLQPLVPIPPQRVMLPTPDKQNATMLVRLGVPLQDTDADYPPLMMANYLLGSGGSSRLWKRIRESEGLSYDVRSRISWNNQEPHSEWQASAIFAPQNQPKVEAAFKEEVARALKDGFTAQELAEGQRGLLAFRRLSRAQDGNLAGAIASNEELGRTFAVSARVDDALSKLTLEQVNAALRTYVKPDAFVSGFAGDFKP